MYEQKNMKIEIELRTNVPDTNTNANRAQFYKRDALFWNYYFCKNYQKYKQNCFGQNVKL